MAIFVFPQITVGRIIRRAKRLVAGIEKDFSSYNQSEVDAFHRWLVDYVTKETNELYDNFVRRELIDRQNIDRNNIPDIFNNLKQRSINEWEMTLNRAFAGLRDSATQGIRSIYTRVGKEILKLRKYKSEFSGRRISKLESVPGLTVHRTGIEGGFEYVFKVSSDRAASVRIVNPNSDNPSATGIQVTPTFSGTGMSDLVVDWIQRHFRGATVRTAPLADVPMSERRQVEFIDKYKMLLIHRGQGVMLYTAKMPDWNDQQLLESPKKLLAFVRARRDLRGRVTFGFVQYLRLLFRTIPRNLEREWMKYVIRMFKERELFHIKGGVVHNSAKVCEWCNEKVLDREAYDFVTNSPRLSVHLYHPNCRHMSEAPPDDYSGRVYTLEDVTRAARRGLLGKLRR